MSAGVQHLTDVYAGVRDSTTGDWPGSRSNQRPVREVSRRETVTVQTSTVTEVRPSPGVWPTQLSTTSDELVTAALQRSLTDLLGLDLVLQHARWNVTGTRFRALHRQLDALTSATRAAADSIAKRCAALGAAPDGRPSSLSSIPEIDAGPLPEVDLIYLLLAHLDGVIDRAVAAIRSELDGDPVSQSIVIAMVAELDKQAWMLAAQR